MSLSDNAPATRLAIPERVRPPTTRRSDDALARLIQASERPEFDRHLTETLQELISFDLAMISLYRDNTLVEVSSRSAPERIHEDVLGSYLKHTFTHSPFFQMHRRKMKSGFYLMENLARTPQLRKPSSAAEMLEIDDGEEIGYLTAGWPKRLKEMDLALRLSDQYTVQIALYRSGNRGFSQADLASVEPIYASMLAVCKQHWDKRVKHLETDDDPIRSGLRRLGSAELSTRELQVIRSLIAGLSEKEIAEELDVSAETVKTHRKRAYQKLDVSSRIELMARLLGLDRSQHV